MQNRHGTTVDRRLMGDLAKLANNHGGRIPTTVPDHYVRWAAGHTSKGR